MKLRTFLIACFACCGASFAWGQISFSPAVVNFAAVYQGAPATVNVTLNNNSTTNLWVEDINAYHGDAFTLTDTAFVIAPGGSRVIPVICDPGQNVNYADWLLVKSSSHPEIGHARLYAIGKYADTYYDATQNLWNEALKTSLKSIISTGMVSHTYNESRDQMYMVIDNQRVNGQGAASNTIECIYTGFMAVGYGSRPDAQTNYGLNTEHTMPQSLFGSTLPELSDLHHLFVTTDASNSERGNSPFGIVTNPNWSVGGSKSNGNLFEPRDVQKGSSVRALLYFLFRYQDYQAFICNMAPVLREWNKNYPPDAVEKKRNADIFSFQRNRNPFVDHPEFMDRIASLCGVDNGDPSPIADWIADTLQYGYVASGSTLDGYYAVVNQGADSLHLSNLSLSSPEFTFIGSPNLSIPKDSLVEIWVRFTPSAPNQNFAAQLTFNTDAPATATRTVHLLGSSTFVSAADPKAKGYLKIYPQPAKDYVTIEFAMAAHPEGTMSLWNLNGQQIRTMPVARGLAQTQVSLAGLAKGVYLLQVQLGTARFSEKLIVE